MFDHSSHGRGIRAMADVLPLRARRRRIHAPSSARAVAAPSLSHARLELAGAEVGHRAGGRRTESNVRCQPAWRRRRTRRSRRRKLGSLRPPVLEGRGEPASMWNIPPTGPLQPSRPPSKQCKKGFDPTQMDSSIHPNRRLSISNSSLFLFPILIF